MDGIQNVLTGTRGYLTSQYVPSEERSIRDIILYTVIFFAITTYLFRYNWFRWLYGGAVLIALASFYRGDTVIREQDHLFRLQ